MNASLNIGSSGHELRGRLHLNEPLAPYTVWRIGGPAERFYKPADLDDVVAFVAGLDADCPIFWLGLGSNLLVRDGGITGTVIYTANHLDGLTPMGRGRIYAEAGVPCAKLARLAWQSGLVGAEFFAGIPGTVGGALAMNAGAWGGETWSLVKSVEVLGINGDRESVSPKDFSVGYRQVCGPKHRGFLSAIFELQAGDGRSAEAKSRMLLRQRAQSQPTGVRSCGSVFRNPPGDHAARLIEQCRLKGFRIGGAHVSLKHANFIINDRDATAREVETLIEYIRKQVLLQRGVLLEPEVRIVGELGAAGACS